MMKDRCFLVCNRLRSSTVTKLLKYGIHFFGATNNITARSLAIEVFNDLLNAFWYFDMMVNINACALCKDIMKLKLELEKA